MRCPKCGYISFDQQQSCKKCSADLTAVTAALAGTGLQTGAAFFLASVLAGESAAEEREFDLAEMTIEEEDAGEPETAADEEVPVVDLAPFAMEERQGGEEEKEELTLAAEEEGISFSLPEEEGIALSLPEETEEAETVEEVPAAAEEDLAGSIDFSLGEEGPEPNVADLLMDREAPARSVESEAVAEEEGGIAFEMEETATPPKKLELEEAEEEEGGIDFDLGLMPEIEMEEIPTEKPEPPPAAQKADTGLSLDLDLDLDDEPVTDDQVFNLEDIDMADLVIEDNGAGRKSRPEDTALDLEDFLNEGKAPAAEEDKTDRPSDIEL